MPTGAFPLKAEQFFERPNFATIASLRPDGQPVTVPTWYMYVDGRILVNMDAERKRVSYLRNDPRVSLTAIDPDDFQTHLSVQGKVVEFQPDDDLADIDRLAEHYTNKPYPYRTRPRLSAWIEIATWHGWGALGRTH